MSKGIKILIVEDDENLRFLVVHRLQAEGYQVLENSDGLTAVETIMTEKIVRRGIHVPNEYFSVKNE